MDEEKLSTILNDGLSRMEPVLPLNHEQRQKLIQYIVLLYKWNKAYNLTAIRNPEQMVIKHLLDSLAICSYLRGKRILDVGTGAGLPGIPLSIVFPEKHFTLLDTNNKKTRFVTQAVSELELSNVDVVQSRVENFQIPGSEQEQEYFDTIISRAYSAVSNMLQQTSHLLDNKGVFLAMKGAYPEAELAEIPGEYKLVKSHQVKVPLLDEERHLLEINFKE